VGQVRAAGKTVATLRRAGLHPGWQTLNPYCRNVATPQQNLQRKSSADRGFLSSIRENLGNSRKPVSSFPICVKKSEKKLPHRQGRKSANRRRLTGARRGSREKQRRSFRSVFTRRSISFSTALFSCGSCDSWLSSSLQFAKICAIRVNPFRLSRFASRRAKRSCLTGRAGRARVEDV